MSEVISDDRARALVGELWDGVVDSLVLIREAGLDPTLAPVQRWSDLPEDAQCEAVIAVTVHLATLVLKSGVR